MQQRRQSLPDQSLFAPGDAENSFALDIPADLDSDDNANEPALDPDVNSDDEPLDDTPLDFDQPDDTQMLMPERLSAPPTPLVKGAKRVSKVTKTSRYGIPYPSLPAAMVKKMTAAALRASGNSKTKVNREILAAVTQASDWFFEQISEDTGAFADHARRKTIDESDVLTLMRRYVPSQVQEESELTLVPQAKGTEQVNHAVLAGAEAPAARAAAGYPHAGAAEDSGYEAEAPAA